MGGAEREVRMAVLRVVKACGMGGGRCGDGGGIVGGGGGDWGGWRSSG